MLFNRNTKKAARFGMIVITIILIIGMFLAYSPGLFY